MKKFIAQTVLLLILIGAGIFFFSPTNSSKKFDIPFLPQQPNFANLQVNDNMIKVEVADTPTKRSKGLSGRQSLGENEGMLFIFEKMDRYPFWMKGLNYPLDFIWIADDKVVDILENVQPPAPKAADSSLPYYSSKVSINKVLEVNAGMVQKLNIKVGDTIKITPL